MVDAALSGLYDELLNLVPAALHHEFGEVFYSGRTAFEQPSPIYLSARIQSWWGSFKGGTEPVHHRFRP